MPSKRNMLTQLDAERMLAVPKYVVEKGKPCPTFNLDFVKNKRYRLALSPSDSIDKDAEYLLDIKISNKLRTKITLHTQENNTHFCLFRLDLNGQRHQNPCIITSNVPEKFKPFAGEMIGGSHVHYHVEGYDSSAWAIPVEYDEFPAKVLTIENYVKELRHILDALSDMINLQTKLTFESELMYGVD